MADRIKKEGGYAFAHGDPEHGGDPGMTLRDWFAGQALVGIASMSGDDFSMSPQDEARWAYDRADAMLADRDKD